MEAVERLKDDLPVAMTMAAFVGISWYICVELNIRLFMTFARRRGLYFWSCVLCSWGVLIQPLATILTDFAVWRNKLVAMIIIYLSWWIMVVPQSFVLYSRLYLVMANTTHIRWVLWFICFNSVVFSVPTMIMGILAVSCLRIRKQSTSNAVFLANVDECYPRSTVLDMGQNSAHSLLRTRNNFVSFIYSRNSQTPERYRHATSR